MLLGLPLIGIIFIAAIPNKQELESMNSKVVALWISLVTLGLALVIVCLYDVTAGGYQFIEFFTISKLFQLDYYLKHQTATKKYWLSRHDKNKFPVMVESLVGRSWIFDNEYGEWSDWHEQNNKFTK